MKITYQIKLDDGRVFSEGDLVRVELKEDDGPMVEMIGKIHILQRDNILLDTSRRYAGNHKWICFKEIAQISACDGEQAEGQDE